MFFYPRITPPLLNWAEASYDNGKLLREASIEYIVRMYSRVSFALIRVGGGGGVCPPDGSKEG